MIAGYNIVGTILFSQPLVDIRNQLAVLRKDQYEPLERIVINQDVPDTYPYIDGVGSKLIEIQKIINQVDISNCFILLITTNTEVSDEINFVTQFYSVDPNPIEFLLVNGDYKKEIKKYSNTACQKLWNHLYVGTDGNINPCCVADHRFPLGNIDDNNVNTIITHNAEQVRSYMAQGYRARACSTCYEKEDCGLRSARQECDAKYQTVIVKDVDIRLTNVCNFKCRMCSEYFSSAIQQETIKLYGKDAVLGFENTSLSTVTRQSKNQRLSKILPFINSDLNSIYFAGGEPLLMDDHYAILDQLITLGITDLALQYNTNLSVLTYKQSNIVDRWRKFGNVQVGASIDASGAVAEYLRHGTVWNDIIANIHTIKHSAPHVKLQVTSTVSCLNIENLINLQITWMKEKLFQIDNFQLHVLTSPNYLSPAVLPQHHKDRLSKIIQQHILRFAGTSLAQQWHDVLQWMNNNDYTFALNDFKHRTCVLDQHRGESFVTIFPEFQDLYD